MNDSPSKSSQDNSMKMLLTASPTSSTTTTICSGLQSPSTDYSSSDESPTNKFISYIHQLAGSCESDGNIIFKDHCYARPWNWKPENIYVKPVKKLFFSKSQNVISRKKQEEFINVEDDDPEPISPPYDLVKVRQSMDELQRVANFIRSENTDDWEEKIDKILWSPVQNRIFNRIVRILNSERMSRLAKSNNAYEPVLRRTSIDTTAKRFRETLASANWDWRISQWLHSLLFDFLPQEYLSIYLDVLQTMRQKIPQLVDKMIAVQSNVNSKTSPVTWESLTPLLKKSWDPVSPVLNTIRPKKLPGNPILIVAPGGMTPNISSRQHKWTAQLGNLGMVITVNPHAGLTTNKITMITGIEQLVQATRAKIQDVRVDYPGRPIVLVGFNTGAALACQIGQLEHITAIVCLGFPFNTADGKRGSPDDTLLEVRCPVMFIIGQNAMLARVDDIEDVREHMLVPTSLVVVGSADDHLRISTSKKISEKISQSMVDRCILDEIADFVGAILLQPHPLPLRAANSINNYENRLKKPEARKRRNSNNGSVEGEPQTLNVKKLRPQSPHSNAVGNNISGISANVLPRGTLVTLTGTTSTQTPRRKARANYANQNFSDQLITSRLTTQQQNLENSSGGITLNIGSFASLAPVGPIRFEPSSINLQTSTPVKPNTLKASNTFIKVSKNNHQVNIGGQQNVAKIKMIMPTKKVSQRATNSYKNVNITEKTGDINMVNVLTPTNNTPLRVSASTATVTNMKTTGNVNIINAQQNVQQTKSYVNSSNAVVGKSAMSSSVLFTPKNSSMTTAAATTMATTSTTPTKVADISMAGGGRKHSVFRCGYQQDQLPPPPLPTGSDNSPKPNTTRSPRNAGTRPAAKISLKSLNHKPSPQTKVQIAEKSNIKINSESIDTIQDCTNKTPVNATLDDELGNILDIPIIFAKDGENLNNLERLSPMLQSSPITLQSEVKTLPMVNTVGNKMVFINNKSLAASAELQQSLQSQIVTHPQNIVTLSQGGMTSGQPTIKYTKIILTKRADVEHKSSPVILTKSNRRAVSTATGNKLLVMEPKNEVKYTQGTTRIPANYFSEHRNSVKGDTLDQHLDSNVAHAKQTFIELNAESSKKP